MTEYEIGDFSLSDWTNKLLHYAEEELGRELDEDEVLGVLDYLVGFVSDPDCVSQALDYLGIE